MLDILEDLLLYDELDNVQLPRGVCVTRSEEFPKDQSQQVIITLTSEFQGFLKISHKKETSKRLKIIVESGVKGSIFNKLDLDKCDLNSHEEIEIVVKKGGSLDFILEQKIHQKQLHKSEISATLFERGALNLSFFNFVKGEAEQDFKIMMIGESSHLFFRGLNMVQDGGSSFLKSKLEHTAQSFADQLIKSTISKGSFEFEGKIQVPKEVKGVISALFNKNLLLGSGAKALSKPSLDIRSEEVKVSHGASFSKLHREQLFYLLSRGLPEKKISGFLINAFCKEIVSSVKVKSIRDIIEKGLLDG